MRLFVVIPVMLFACGGDPRAEDNDTSSGDASLETAAQDSDDTTDIGDTSTDEGTSPVTSDIADTSEPPDTADTSVPSDTADSIEPPDTPETNDPRDTLDAADSAAEHDLTEPEVDSDTSTPEVDTSDVSDTTTTTTCPSSVVVEAHDVVPSPYVPVCSEVDYPTDPPTSGPHYPVWATYKTYLEPINPGFLVHSLKHGAIVITWRCPEGCAEDLTALRELINRRPQDPRCDSLLYHRIVVAPRPDQDRTLVASAWGHSFKADCFDLPALSAFIDAHYGQGLEDDCFEGVDVEKIRPDNPWYCPP